eukprot:4309384-Amphidinium_carterae.1
MQCGTVKALMALSFRHSLNKEGQMKASLSGKAGYVHPILGIPHHRAVCCCNHVHVDRGPERKTKKFKG